MFSISYQANVKSVAYQSFGDNFTAAPVINPAWLTDTRDREVLIAAFKRAREVLSMEEMEVVLIGEE